MQCDVMSLENKKVGSIELDDAVFGLPVRSDLIARAVNWQLAKRRKGSHKTKQRSEVRGTTAKMMKQKGSGRARHGNEKAPQMRGGGVAFGPVVRSHAHSLPKKVRRLALKTALSAKQAAGSLVIIDAAKLKSGKTKDLAQRVNQLGWNSALVIEGAELDTNFANAAANVLGMNILPTEGANVYDIMRSGTLVLTQDAVNKLVERLK
ncbi:MAG: 50S ribosomal protein L4 [Rhodospirillales bacterium]|jgi:large subunit ribosomal protein L4